MKTKIPLKWLWLIVGIAGILISVRIIFFPTQSYFILPALPQINSELPFRLKIPSINVDSTVEYVGLTMDGAMDVPKEPENVAWYNLGIRPGEIGSAVIDGHSGYKNNKPAVFDNLYKLQKGDKIYVEDRKGGIITFVVHEIKKYSLNAEVPSY